MFKIQKDLGLIFVLIFLSIHFFSCSHHISDSSVYWKRNLPVILEDSSQQFFIDTLIRNNKTAIEIAEPILISKFGTKCIKEEKPFQVCYVNGYWIVNGTLPKGAVEGTFNIILRATDGKIIQLIHYK